MLFVSSKLTLTSFYSKRPYPKVSTWNTHETCIFEKKIAKMNYLPTLFFSDCYRKPNFSRPSDWIEIKSNQILPHCCLYLYIALTYSDSLFFCALTCLPMAVSEKKNRSSDFNPLTLRAAKIGLTILKIFNLQKHFLKKYLKEKCWLEAKQQLLVKYLFNFRFIPKLFPKVQE